MSVAAAITRAIGGALLVLAAFAAVGAIVALIIGDGWIDDGRTHGDDDQAEAGADLMLGAAVTFGVAALVGVLGGFLFWLGASLLRRHEARAASGLPTLPDD